MQVSMFRGRRHIAATIDPDAASDDEAPMEIIAMDPEESEQGAAGNVMNIVPDPVMTWKAQACHFI